MTYKLHEEYSCEFYGGPLKPKGFAIHWWGDPNHKPKFWGIVNVLLARSKQQSASVHFVAEAGLVACLISPTRVAWAQGDGANGWGNLNLVSIECNPRCTADDRETVAELMADQHILNGVPLVAYPHKNFNATQCPGVWEQYIPWLVQRAKQIVAEKVGQPAQAVPAPVAHAAAPAAPAAKSFSDSEIHWVVEASDTLSKIQAHYNGPSVAEIAAHNGIDPDRITPGQKIWIPGRLVWIIEAPDNLRSVAAYYGLAPEYLASLNGLAGPDSEIYIGNTLVVKP